MDQLVLFRANSDAVPTPATAPLIELATARLRLVALDVSQAPAMYAYASDEETTRFVAWPRHESIEVTQRFLVWSQVRYAAGGHYDWGVTLADDAAFIGTCGYAHIENGIGEIGYVLAKPYWGRGYATEAAQAVIDFGFVHLGLQMVKAEAFPANVRSLQVLAKLGLLYRETTLYTNEYDGQTRAVSVWQLARERWQARQA